MADSDTIASAFWTSPSDRTDWENVRSRGEVQRFEASADESIAEWVLLGPTIPEGEDSHIVRAIALLGKTTIKWQLDFYPRPKRAPPEEVVRRHEKLGGEAGLFNLLGEEALVDTPTSAIFDLHFHLEADDFACRVLPRKPVPELDGPIEEFANAVEIEQIGYRLQGGTAGIEEVEIAYLPEKRLFTVDLRARGLLEFEDSLHPPFFPKLQNAITHQLFFPRTEMK